MKKRTVALLCAAVALLGVIFGGTMAWLTRGSDAVVNTFTTASVGLDLTETDREYIMAPGAVLDKDPKVIVDKDSASCYLFVEVFEENFEKKPVTWEEAEGWIEVDNLKKTTADGKVTMRVFYREFDEKKVGEYTKEKDSYTTDDEGNHVFGFLKGDQVTINKELTKADMNAYKEGKIDAYPQLIFTAYAIQRDYLKNADGKELKAPEDIVAIYKLAKDNAAVTTDT